MKRITVVILMLLLTIFLSAQTEWEMIIHSDAKKIHDEIKEMAASGYEPVGIEMVRDEVKPGILIMYIQFEESDFEDYKFAYFEDGNETASERITKEAEKGYLPMDLTHTPDGTGILFVKYKDVKIKEWAYEKISPTYEDIGTTLQKYCGQTNSFVPVGIAARAYTDPDYNFYSMLFLKIPGIGVEDFNVYTFNGLENFQTGIDELLAEGWGICGFSLYGEEWDVVVVKIGESDTRNNSSDGSKQQIVAKNAANIVAGTMASYIEYHPAELKRLMKLNCSFGEIMDIDGNTSNTMDIQLPTDYNCKIDGKDVIVSHRNGISATVQWLYENQLIWEGNWGDDSLIITNANDRSFNFKFQV